MHHYLTSIASDAPPPCSRVGYPSESTMDGDGDVLLMPVVKAAYRRASRDLARALLKEAIADCRVENLESAAKRDEGGGSESSEGGRTELPSGGSGQGVRLRGREAAGHLGPVNGREEV